MTQLYKTALGISALQNKDIKLNAKQRRLLLLIDHPDFHSLSVDYRLKIAPPEIIEDLIQWGFLSYAGENITTYFESQSTQACQQNIEEENPFNEELIYSSEPAGSQIIVQETYPETETVQLEPVHVEKLSFDEIQLIMIQTLKTHCGLMAKPLIQQIERIKTLSQLKACQMQWLTILNESRIRPAQLQQTLQTINHSVEHLHGSH